MEGNEYMSFIREGAMLLCALLSLYFTPKQVRKDNFFYLSLKSLGIFATMTPALLYLESNAASFGLLNHGNSIMLQVL